jgi:oxygen-dependent protoporphyrinogen oxidase
MGLSRVSTAVVGGGISGLALAYRLKKSGGDVTLFEACKDVGGMIGTIYVDGYELDLGPVTISETPPLMSLIDELGLQVLEASDAVDIRYIYSGGKLHRVKNPITSSLLSPLGKLAMLRAAFTSKSKENETVADHARRRFGEEAYRKLFDPMMKGIYAGDPELLSAEWCLPKRRGPRKIFSIQGGLKSVTKALADKLGNSVKLNSPIDRLPGFDKVYLTTPAYITAEIIGNGDLSDKLKSIRYSDVTQIYCELLPGERKFDGFGFLVPSEERMSLLGAVCVSNVFPSKAPEGKMLFVLFCAGGSIVKDVLAEFNRVIQPAFNKVLHIKEWKKAIPQFYVGHDEIVNLANNLDARVSIRGNYITGVAVGDCVSFF